MASYVVFVGFFISLYYLKSRGLEFAFLNVWIPIFLLLPFAFTAHIPMVPVRSFAQAAIVPILYVLIRERLHLMRMGRMEWLILLYVVWRTVADYQNRGYKDAQNYGFYMLSLMVGPYLIGAYVIRNRKMDVLTAKMFVFIFMLLFPMFLYEAKFWMNPIFKVLSPLFPSAFSGLSIRYGLARTAGTFEHPILCCIMIIAVYRLHKWLAWYGEWKKPQSGWMAKFKDWTDFLPFSFEARISAVLILMALMTISRGPWIGGIAGAVLVAAGNTKNRKRAIAVVLAVFVIGGFAGKAALQSYTTAAEGQVVAAEAQTMIYRQVMVEKYQEFIFQRPWEGWGLTTVPVIKGMESIDNAFFLMALQHGIAAPAIFILMFIYAIVTQVIFGLKSPAGLSPLGFTFSGIYLMCFISFTTVYMGAQTEPLLFLLLGWGEGLKARGIDAPQTAGSKPVQARLSTFRRVLT